MTIIKRKKLKQAIEILRNTDIDLWITFARETAMMKDPIMPLISDMYFSGLGAIIISKNGVTAITSYLDKGMAEQTGLYDNVLYYDSQFEDCFTEFFNKNNMKKIALNYSEDDPAADGLTYGLYMRFVKLLKNLGFDGEIVSSDDVLTELRSVKIEEEVECIKKSIELAEKICEEAIDFIKVGVTEKDIFNFFQDRCRIYGTEPSWGWEQCPGVDVGASGPGGHCGPTDIAVEPGCIVGLDFGVVYNGYCSDIQRKYYVLREGETEAPPHIKHAFDSVMDTIRAVKDYMKEGLTGNQVDTMAREYLKGKGYGEWKHNLGHQVGLYVHDGGALLGKRKNKNNKAIDMPLKNGYVFSVEPAIKLKEGGMCMEEMMYITPEETKFISHPQEKLYLIKTS